MIRFLFFCAALLGLAIPAAAAERRYAVTDFDRVVVEGPFSVRLTVGPPSSAIATGSTQAIDAVTVDVQGTTLRVRRNINAWGATAGRASDPAVITLTTRNLRTAQVAGSGLLQVTGARGLSLDLAADGSSHLIAEDIAADNLAFALRGSGTIAASGTAKTLTAAVQGSGSLDGERLVADNATVTAATTGEVAITVRRAVTVSANGLGSVVIGGRPACTVRGVGASEVVCGAER